jgi:hypothetical protein
MTWLTFMESKDIAYDGIKKTAKMTSNNNQQQTTTQKIKDQATRTPLQTDSEPMSLVNLYGISVSQMTTDMIRLSEA